jgi:hypothetical protein
MTSHRFATSRTLSRRRDALVRKAAEVGPVLRGSLCTARRGGHLAHQLTVSVKGKTHTVYVPVDMVEEVRAWISNYRRLQRLLEQISKLNMALIHRHVPESRGAGRSPRPRSPRR